MAQQIYESFYGGLSPNEREGNDNQFWVGRDIDVYGYPGYLRPASGLNNISFISTAQEIVDIIPDPVINNSQAFGIARSTINSHTGRIYRIQSIESTPSMDASFNTIGYDTVTDLQYAKGTIATVAGTRYLFLAYKTLGRGVLGQAQIASWGFTKVLQTLSSGSQNGEADIIEWENSLWILSARYVDQYVLATNTMYITASGGGFDLGDGWQGTCLFTNDIYLGIFSSRKDSVISNTGTITQTQVYLIDGSSTTQAIKIIPLTGINKVYACKNLNGTIYFLADGRKSSHILCKLTDTGYDVVRDLQTDVIGNFKTLYAPPFASAIDTFNNKLIFGVSNYAMVFQYDPDKDSLTMLASPSISLPCHISTVRAIFQDSFLISYQDGGTYKLGDLPLFFQGGAGQSGGKVASTNAQWKPAYLDLPQRASINYVKVYFRPLSGTLSITVSMDTNYGTSNTPKTDAGVASFSVDGAITFKKFDLGGIECHSFRPVISFGDYVAVSKVVVDYDLLDD